MDECLSKIPTLFPWIVIVGPTASGKTTVASWLAKQIGGEIIVCDSYQLREGLPILTAKPQGEDEKNHRLLGFFPLNEPVNAGRFAEKASLVIEELKQKNKPIILCGGTGLYIKALIDGWCQGPTSSQEVRNQLRQQAKTEEGLKELYFRLKEIDPQLALRISPRDYVRIERGLEVFIITGKTLSSWHENQKKKSSSQNVIYVGLDPETERLQERIKQRTEQMFEQGVCDEVLKLVMEKKENIPKPPIGYLEILSQLKGELSLSDVKVLMNRKTWHYARKQRIWFKKEKQTQWAKNTEEAKNLLIEKIQA